MTTKLKIDLMQGILEVEGSETFVKAIYSDFKSQFIGDDAAESLAGLGRGKRRAPRARAVPKTQPPEPASPPPPPSPPEFVPVVPPPIEVAAPLPEPEPPPAVKPNYRLIPDLNLGGQNDHASLVEFMDAKFPITNEERNLVFLYYLQYIAGQKTISIDHIFTCYKEAKIRVPLNLEVSLQTTADQRHWIKMAQTGRLSVTPSGKLYVDKQLPKKLKS